jgi:glycosyltransferase involved in cell wall biosynthesis
MAEQKRRLLFITNKLAPMGGAEVQLFHLAKALVARDYAVTVCCIDHSAVPDEAVAAAGFELVEFKIESRWRRAVALPRLIRLARRADVVQCTMWDPSLWGRIAAIVARRPVIVADHATDRSVQISTGGTSRGDWIALHNRLLDPFTYATVTCATSQREVLRGEGVHDEKIIHIPNGIPIDELRDAAARAGGRRELGLPEAGPIVMQIGFFRREKNQIGALEAFPKVLEAVPDAQLVFVGDGPELERVRGRAAEIGADWVTFLGKRGDVGALLPAAAVLWLPSISDAMPMTILEAMALGVPTVASDVGDVGRLLGGRAGITVPAGDLDALAAATVDLLLDPDRRQEISAAALELSHQFSSSTMAERYAALFEGAYAGSPALSALGNTDVRR